MLNYNKIPSRGHEWLQVSSSTGNTLVSKLWGENPTFQEQLRAKTRVQKNPDAVSVLLHAVLLRGSMALNVVARNIGKSQTQTHTHADKYAVL